MNRNTLYQVLYRNWPSPPAAPPESGYTVLLPVPADLPVFLKIAMNIIAAQDAAHRRETIVLPDAASAAALSDFESAYGRYSATWPQDQPIRVVPLDWISRGIAGRMRNPGLNHWLQFVRGVGACRTAHAVLHDADLFLADRGFLESQYSEAIRSRAACLGISPVWDDWYRQNDCGHLVATWELLFDTRWARSFAPWEHRGHEGEINGRRHIFDTTLLPQCRTPASRIILRPPAAEFTHFNYVICTYRLFQKSAAAGTPFEDEYLRLLLVRLLIDAVDDSGWTYDVPPLSELARGLRDNGAPVTLTAAATAEHYSDFRGKLDRLISTQLLGAMASDALSAGIREFDKAFGWSPSRAPAAHSPAERR
jgi:hypothetical protein